MAGLTVGAADGNFIGLIEYLGAGVMEAQHWAKEALVCEANQWRNS